MVNLSEDQQQALLGLRWLTSDALSTGKTTVFCIRALEIAKNNYSRRSKDWTVVLDHWAGHHRWQENVLYLCKHYFELEYKSQVLDKDIELRLETKTARYPGALPEIRIVDKYSYEPR